MNFIELTKHDGTKMTCNSLSICMVLPTKEEDATLIFLEESCIEVKANYEELKSTLLTSPSFTEFTKHDGKKMICNISSIWNVTPTKDESATLIYLNKNCIEVKSSYEVVKTILLVS